MSANRCEITNNETGLLCTQLRATIAAESAANAAWTSAYFAGAGALLSFVSIALVLVALAQTRKAHRLSESEFAKSRNEAAEAAVTTASALAQATRSAEASTSQSKIAAEMFANEFRPYVMVAPASLNLDTNSDQPYTQILLCNIGRGVARNCRVLARTEIGDSIEPKFSATRPVGGAVVHLMPQEKKDLPVRPDVPFNKDEISAIVLGMPQRMWTHGSVEYDDDLGKQHVTHFAFAYSGGPLTGRDASNLPRYESPIAVSPPS